MSDSPEILKTPEYSEIDSGYTSFDTRKFLFILQKRLPFMILIVAVGIIISLLIVRYTKPEFRSSSIIKLDIKSEASVLGLSSIEEGQTYNNISSEIELLRSRLFFGKVLDAVNLGVSVYVKGNILNDEKYPHSPFRIKYKIHNGAYLNKPFYIDVLTNDRYQLTYNQGDTNIKGEYAFGETISNNDFVLSVSINPGYGADIQGDDFFFILNSRSALIEYISRNLTVEPLNLKANTIQVSFKDYNRYKSRDLVNAIDTIYLKYTRAEKSKANNQKIKFLNERLLETEDRLREFEDYFESFTIQNKTTNLQGNISTTIRYLNLIDSQQFNIRNRLTRLIEIEKNLAEGDSIKLNFADLRLLPGDIRVEINTLNQLFTEREILLGSYNKNTQAYQKKESEVNLILDMIAAGLKQYIDNLEQQNRDLISKKMQLEKEFVSLPSKNTEFTKNQRYYTLQEEFYLSLIQRKAEFQLELAGTVTDFKILSSANTPSKPLSPDKWTIYTMGFIGGLIFSFFYVGLVYLSNNRITSQSELERSTQIPILGTIPFYNDEKMLVSKLVIDNHSNSQISESIRTIRTNMQFLLPETDTAKISITSTVSGEGKTFIAINLGAAFSLSNKKVLLLDLDMRKPIVHEIFGHTEIRKGISTLLIGKDTLIDCIKPTTLEGFHYIPAGPTPPNPSELLLSEEFDKLITAVSKEYDLIILDTPPIGIVTDGVLVMNKSDLQIFVIRADYSKKIFIDNLEKQRQLHKFSNLSIILNGIHKSVSQHYGYGYRSGYYVKKRKRKLFI